MKENKNRSSVGIWSLILSVSILCVTAQVMATSNIIDTFSETELLCASSGQILITYADADSDPCTGVFVGPTWYPNETQIALYPIQGDLSVNPPWAGGQIFFSTIGANCGETGSETKKGKFVIRFIDATAPGWVWDDPGTWQERPILEAQLKMAHDEHPNYTTYIGPGHPGNVVNPNPYLQARAYEHWNAGGAIVDDFSQPGVYPCCVLQPGTLSGAIGFSEILFSTDFDENTIDDLFLFGTTTIITLDPDCNGNGVHDEDDIANGTSTDCNGNGTPDECDIETGLRPGSAALYHCDENGGTTVFDFSGNAIDGANANVTYSPDTPFPASGNFSLEFDDKADGVTIPAGPGTLLNSYTALTIEAFIKPTNTADMHFILWAADDPFGLWINSDTLYFGLSGSGGARTLSVPFTATGVWTHVAGIYDGVKAKLYVDGMEEDSVSAAIGTITVDSGLYGNVIRIGNDETAVCCVPTRDFRGLIDQVRIVKHTLDATEILFDATHSLTPGGSNDCNGNGIPNECDVMTFAGPTPYYSEADSPFDLSGDFFLEDFEDGLLNTPGVNASAGVPYLPGINTDSVDADDGVIDGSGLAGNSFFSGSGAAGITFTFDRVALGGFPRRVGIVWTDGFGDATFEAFDKDGSSLGTVGPVPIGDEFFTGTTAEDRFFGVRYVDGISAIHIANSSGGIEVDHLQYGQFSGGWVDCNNNGIPDDCELGDYGCECLAADFNNDGIVDIKDLVILAHFWLLNEPLIDIAPLPPVGDGIGNILDFGVFAEHWLEQCE